MVELMSVLISDNDSVDRLHKSTVLLCSAGGCSAIVTTNDSQFDLTRSRRTHHQQSPYRWAYRDVAFNFGWSGKVDCARQQPRIGVHEGMFRLLAVSPAASLPASALAADVIPQQEYDKCIDKYRTI